MNDIIYGIVIGLLIGFSIGMVFGIYEIVNAVSEYYEDQFCMDNDFAERVMSCFVGNQSRCLSVTYGDGE